MKTSFLAAALLLPLAVLAQPAPLLTATDPEGDDVGDGSLVYPRSTAWVAGDLDLRSLRVFAEGKDLRFEASLRNPVRSPATVMSPGMGTQSLSAFARHGFYAFNIDIYIDADRAPGSGNTVTLPGRRAQLDPAHAWEKAVVLTPRPELMQRELIAALREISSAGEAEVAATVQRSVFFPTQIRVQGRTVSFIVPGTFIDAAGLAGASVTAFVTAAPLAIDAGIKMSFGDTGAVRDRFALGVAQPDVGEPELTMGHRAAPAPATAVVDLLSPNPNQQALQLAPGGRLTGLSPRKPDGCRPVAAASASGHGTGSGHERFVVLARAAVHVRSLWRQRCNAGAGCGTGPRRHAERAIADVAAACAAGLAGVASTNRGGCRRATDRRPGCAGCAGCAGCRRKGGGRRSTAAGTEACTHTGAGRHAGCRHRRGRARSNGCSSGSRACFEAGRRCAAGSRAHTPAPA
ncbi:MAG: hypothetical protein IPK42_05805 [Betaproteobacteria bacterium]|nr:hypothetical protein [Betaproteobacteria bacterium]